MMFGQSIARWTLGYSRIFSITERVIAQFRFQAYNLANTPQFTNPEWDLFHKPWAPLVTLDRSAEHASTPIANWRLQGESAS